MRVILIVVAILLVILVVATWDQLLLGVIVPVVVWAFIGWLAGQVIRWRGYSTSYDAPINMVLGIGGGIGLTLLLRLVGAPIQETRDLIMMIVFGAVGAFLTAGIVNTAVSMINSSQAS